MLWESNSMTGPRGHSQSLTAFFEQKPSMAYTSSLACSRWTKKSERPDPYSIHTKRCWFISNRFIHLTDFKEIYLKMDEQVVSTHTLNCMKNKCHSKLIWIKRLKAKFMFY